MAADTARGAWMLFVLGALTAFAPMSIDMYLPAFGQIGHALGAGAHAMQLTLVVYFVGLATGQLVWGALADRYGRLRPLRAGIVLYVIASLGCAFATRLDALLAWRALQGLAGCAGIVLARSMVRDAYATEEVARVFSRLALVLGAAPILAPLAGGWLVAHGGWRWVFGVLAGFGVLCLAAVATLPETLPPQLRRSMAWRSALHGYAALRHDRSYVRHAAVAAITQAGMFAYILASPAVLIGLYRVSPAHFGLYFGANACGLIAVSQLNHALLPRFGMARMLEFGVRALAAASALLVLAALHGGLWWLLPPLFAFVALLGLCMPNALALAMAEQGRRAGSAAALIGTLQYGCAAAAGGLVAWLGGGSAVPMALVMAGCAWTGLALLRGSGRAGGGAPKQSPGRPKIA